MIAITLGGLAIIIVIAITVGVVDSFQARAWRRIAAERRANWEARQLERQGPRRDVGWDD